jgi:hypothetical protein
VKEESVRKVRAQWEALDGSIAHKANRTEAPRHAA